MNICRHRVLGPEDASKAKVWHRWIGPPTCCCLVCLGCGEKYSLRNQQPILGPMETHELKKVRKKMC